MGAGMEVDSPPPTRRTSGTPTPTPTEILQKAFQTIDPIINAVDQRIEVKNAWETIRSALEKQAAAREDQGACDASERTMQAKDLNEVKAQLKGLTGLVHKLVGQARTTGNPYSYAAAARRGHESKGVPTGAGARVLPVPARQVRQVAITGRDPTAMQGRTAQEIVQEANAAIGTNAIAAARRLPSGDTILTFHERESRAK